MGAKITHVLVHESRPSTMIRADFESEAAIYQASRFCHAQTESMVLETEFFIEYWNNGERGAVVMRGEGERTWAEAKKDFYATIQRS